MIDQDPLLASPQDLRGTKVLQVWINGTQVYDAATAAPVEIKQDEAMKAFDLGDTEGSVPAELGR